MAKTKPKTKIKATKPAAKAKGKPVAKAKPAAKKVAAKKPAAPAKKGLLKTASKLAGKAMAAISKDDKEKAKKDAAKAKLEAAKEKERAKKAAAAEKLAAAKEKERAKKAAAAEKLAAAKEKEKAKKDAEKAKLQAGKDAEKAKKLAAKEAEKAAKIQAKEDEKAKKLAEKEKAKRIARGEDVEDEDPAPRSRGGDDDDDEEDFKRVAAKGKTGRKFDEDGSHDLERGYKKFSVNELEGKIADEIADLREHFAWKEILGAISTLDFFVDPKDDSCVEKGCDNIRTTQSWCRLHYLKNWKGIQRKKEILAEGKLQEYIEELISKYPPKYIEAIMGDLSDDKEFYKVLNELNITNEFDFEEEDFESADNDSDDGDDIGIEATFTGSMRYEATE